MKTQKDIFNESKIIYQMKASKDNDDSTIEKLYRPLGTASSNSLADEGNNSI